MIFFDYLWNFSIFFITLLVWCDISFTIKSYSKVISSKDLVKSFSLCLKPVSSQFVFSGTTSQHPPLNYGHLWYLTSSIMPDNLDRQMWAVWQCPDRQITETYMMSDRTWHPKLTPASDIVKILVEAQNHKSDNTRQNLGLTKTHHEKPEVWQNH